MSHSRSPFGDWQSYLRSVFERDAARSDTVASTVMVEIRRGRQVVTGRPGDFPLPHRPDNGAGARAIGAFVIRHEEGRAIEVGSSGAGFGSLGCDSARVRWPARFPLWRSAPARRRWPSRPFGSTASDLTAPPPCVSTTGSPVYSLASRWVCPRGVPTARHFAWWPTILEKRCRRKVKGSCARLIRAGLARALRRGREP
jgi:hypothetical protein